MNLRQYILVRKDLPVEVQLVQVAHAAGESIIVPIHANTTSCIILHVEDEVQLWFWESILWNLLCSYKDIREPDPPWNNQMMAIGVTPREDTPELRKIFRDLPLARFG